MLDPDAQMMLDMAREAGRPPFETMTPDEARAQVRAMRAILRQVPPDVAELRDLTARGPHGPIPLRLYRARAATDNAPQPCIVYFHGGGWLFGDLDTHDNLCRHLALAADCTVISVDYRLAPEHKFPAAFDDAYAATKWVSGNAATLGIDRTKLVVAGDSAGGNLATAVALMARQNGGDPKLAYQLLIYPVVDMDFAHDSFKRVGEGYSLTEKSMIWFREHYLRSPADRDDWRASPLRAKDLSKLPPAFVITAGADPLCDEGEAYARALEKHNVRVIHRHYPGQMHAFIGLSGWVKAADEAIAEMGAALKREWGRPA
jgi:acetyl esterase